MDKPTSKELQQKAKELAEERQRARTDKMFLANDVLGCTFVEDVHSELFSQFLPMDDSKHLQFLDDKKERLILWARGHYKTTAAMVEIIQLILNYPNIRIVIMRSTKEATQEWLREIVSHFTGEAENSRLSELFPEFCGTRKELHATADHFIVPCRTRKQLREATVTTASSQSNKTGKHFDAGFFDDLVTDKNAANPKQIEKVTKGYYMCIPLIDPGGYMYVTGTRYDINDLYAGIIQKNTNNAWIISVKTCWRDEEQQEVRFPQREFALPNGVVKIIGFTKEMLLQILHSDPLMFCTQYLNQPAIESDRHFTDAMFREALVNPEVDASLSRAVLFVDVASSTGKKGDDSVILCGKVDENRIPYVADGIGDRWSPEQLALNVIQMTTKHRPLKVLIENSAAAQFFVPLLNMIAAQHNVQIPLDFMKVDTRADAKVIRVKSVSAFLTRGRLKLFSNLPCLDKLISQSVNFTGERWNHDDYPDTLGYLANYFIGGIVAAATAESKNYMIAMLERDLAAERMQQLEGSADWNQYADTCGSDFCC